MVKRILASSPSLTSPPVSSILTKLQGSMCYAESSLGAPTVQQALSVALPLVCANCGTNMQPQALSDHVWSFGIKCWQISSDRDTASVELQRRPSCLGPSRCLTKPALIRKETCQQLSAEQQHNGHVNFHSGAS
ncbi:hypothetical protein WJX79_001961 [Trebouxia sp. C0005]